MSKLDEVLKMIPGQNTIPEEGLPNFKVLMTGWWVTTAKKWSNLRNEDLKTHNETQFWHQPYT